MPKYQGFGKEVVKESGDLTLHSGSVTVCRKGKPDKVLNAHNTYKVIAEDEIWRAADADYDIVAH
jgi:hypothetical protein